MNIPVPKGMKSPTVIIVGQGTMEGSDKKNTAHEKRMDNLEKKFDQQYKMAINKESYVKEIDKLHKSFMGKFEKVIDSNKSVISKLNTDLAKSLKRQIDVKVSQIDKGDSNKSELKTFMSKISDLETAISKIGKNNKEVKVSYNTNKLDSSFDKLYEKMEQLVKSARPRMYPSPS